MMLREIVSVLIILVAAGFASDGPTWSYTHPDHNPSKWYNTHSVMCSGRFQSPIALVSHVATFMGTEHEAMVHISEKRTRNISREAETFTATNNGHSLAVSIPDGAWKVTLNNQAKEDHTVAQFHFHWGSMSTKGSEHTLDNTAFPLEARKCLMMPNEKHKITISIRFVADISVTVYFVSPCENPTLTLPPSQFQMHIVTYSSMYGSFAEAKSAPGGLAVIGVFFQLTTTQAESSLSKMGNLFSRIGELTNATSTVNVVAFSPDVLLPQNKDEFFRYQGSLTTPPCTENVQWTVMRHPLRVTNEDLEKLRSLHFGDSDDKKPMQDNFRPVLSLNTGHAAQPRVLYKSWSASGRLAPALFVISIQLLVSMLSH